MKTPWRLLLIVPAAIVMATPLYARESPRLIGIPFFVWFQFAMVLIGMAITLVVFVLDKQIGSHKAEDVVNNSTDRVMNASSDGAFYHYTNDDNGEGGSPQ